MYIELLTLHNFKSFYGTTTIPFSRLAGLFKVTGRIGSGKTTIGEAIVYGLYGRVANKNNASLISWGEKKSYIDLELQSKGYQIKLHREINSYGTSPLQVWIDGKELVANNKLSIQSQLESEYLDIPRTTAELLCIISFNNFKSLSTLNTRDARQFLNDVLGLDLLDTYIGTTKEISSELKTRLISSRAIQENLQKQIEDSKSIDSSPEDTTSLENSIKDIKEEIAKLKEDKDRELVPLEDRLKRCEDDLKRVTILGKERKKELSLLSQGTCPTCGSPIDPSQITRTQDELKRLGEEYKRIFAIKGDLTRIYQEISSRMTKCIDEKLSLVKSQENDLKEKMIQNRLREEFNSQRLVELEKDLGEMGEKVKSEEELAGEYDQLLYILQNEVREAILSQYVPLINSKIQEMCEIMELEFIPEYDLEFKCTIRRGEESISTSSLSTGQQKLVDMIIILSILGSVLSRVESNVIFLDELFSNLDKSTREDLLYIFRSTLPETTCVLIISHQDIDDDLFTGNIRLGLSPLDGGRVGSTLVLPEGM